MTNREFAKDKRFRLCCAIARTKATRRQAAKFLNKRGRAYQVKRFFGDSINDPSMTERQVTALRKLYNRQKGGIL